MKTAEQSVPAAPDNTAPTAHLSCVLCREEDTRTARFALCGERLLGIPVNDPSRILICADCRAVKREVDARLCIELPCGHRPFSAR